MPTPTHSAPSLATAVAETRAWVDRAVIGLNLCPFAKSVQMKGQVRYVGTAVTKAEALLEVLVDELLALATADAQQIDTTVLVHPFVLSDFAAYNDFLDVADGALVELRLQGVLQIASFHPHYRFAGLAARDITHATNRSPHPLLHLLREASVANALAAFPRAAEEIVSRNQRRLQQLGPAGWARLQQQCRDDAAGPAVAAAVVT